AAGLRHANRSSWVLRRPISQVDRDGRSREELETETLERTPHGRLEAPLREGSVMLGQAPEVRHVRLRAVAEGSARGCHARLDPRPVTLVGGVGDADQLGLERLVINLLQARPELHVAVEAEVADDLLNRRVELQVELFGLGHDETDAVSERFAASRVRLGDELSLRRVERHSPVAKAGSGLGVEGGHAVFLASSPAPDDPLEEGGPHTFLSLAGRAADYGERVL